MDDGEQGFVDRYTQMPKIEGNIYYCYCDTCCSSSRHYMDAVWTRELNRTNIKIMSQVNTILHSETSHIFFDFAECRNIDADFLFMLFLVFLYNIFSFSHLQYKYNREPPLCNFFYFRLFPVDVVAFGFFPPGNQLNFFLTTHVGTFSFSAFYWEIWSSYLDTPLNTYLPI